MKNNESDHSLFSPPKFGNDSDQSEEKQRNYQLDLQCYQPSRRASQTVREALRAPN